MDDSCLDLLYNHDEELVFLINKLYFPVHLPTTADGQEFFV